MQSVAGMCAREYAVMPARSEAGLSSCSVHSRAASAVLLRQCATSLCSSARTARFDFRRSCCSASLRRSSSTCTDQRPLCPVLHPRIPTALAEGSRAFEEGSEPPLGTARMGCPMHTIPTAQCGSSPHGPCQRLPACASAPPP